MCRPTVEKIVWRWGGAWHRLPAKTCMPLTCGNKEGYDCPETTPSLKYLEGMQILLMGEKSLGGSVPCTFEAPSVVPIGHGIITNLIFFSAAARALRASLLVP
jgi:hypothetical protein